MEPPSAKEKELLSKVFQVLDEAGDDRVRRQDLMNIEEKLNEGNEQLLEDVKESKWLEALLRPESWSSLLVNKSSSRTGSMTFSKFEDMWTRFQKDRVGNSASTDNQQDELSEPPKQPKKVLRALSVSSASIAHENPTGIRVSVSLHLGNRQKDFARPAQLVNVRGDFEELCEEISHRFGIKWSQSTVLLHGLLRAQISRVEDLRDGDQLEVHVGNPLPERISFDRKTKHVVQERRTKKGMQKTFESDETSALEDEKDREKEEDEGSESSIEDFTTRCVPSRFATFTRRPSWKEFYDNGPLPAAVKCTIRETLQKVSTSSIRWKEKAKPNAVPDEKTLKERLQKVLKRVKQSSFEVEDVLSIVERVGIAFWLAKNHSRLLFAAVDQESTGEISKRHLEEMILVWLEVWNEHQETLALSFQSGGMVDHEDTSEPVVSSRPKSAKRARTNSSNSAKDKLPPFYSKVSTVKTHNKNLSKKAMSQGERYSNAKKKQWKRPSSRKSWRPTSAASSQVEPGTPLATGNKRSVKFELLDDVPSRPSTAPSRNQIKVVVARRRPCRFKDLKTEEDFLRRLHTEEKKGDEDPELLMRYGTFLLRQVQRTFRKMIQNDQSTSFKGENLLQDENSRSRLEKASTILKRAVNACADRNGEDSSDIRGEALSCLAEVSNLQGDETTAKTLHRDSVQQAPCNSTVLCNYAHFLCALGDVSGARDYYLEALIVDEQNVDALLGYALLLLSSQDEGDQDLAQEYFERAKKSAARNRAPKDLRARVFVHLALYESEILKQNEAAIENLEKAVKLDETLCDAWYHLGQLRFHDRKDEDGALEAFENGLKQRGATHLHCQIALAQILSSSSAAQDTDRAEELFQEAIKQTPEDTKLLLAFAEFNSHVRQRDYMAVELFKQAIDSSSADMQAECHFKFARYYQRRANLHEDDEDEMKANAKEQFEAAVEKAPSSSKVGFLVALGQHALESKDFHAAKNALKEANVLDPVDINVKWLLAITEKNLGGRQEAGKLFRLVYREAPENPFVLVHFARFLLQFQGPVEVKQHDVAENMLKKALANINLVEQSQSDHVAELFLPGTLKASAYLTLGQILVRDPERYDAGTEMLERAVDEMPSCFEANFSLAAALSRPLMSSRFAIYDGRRFKDQQPLVRRSLQLLGAAAEIDDRSFEPSLASATLYICLAEIVDEPLAKQAALEASLKQSSRAIRRLSKAQKRNSSTSKSKKSLQSRLSEAHFLSGVALERQRKFKEAFASFHDALTFNSGHILAIYHLAVRKEYDRNDLEGAQSLILQVFSNPPTESSVDFKVLCKRVLHDYELAEAKFMVVDGEKDDPAAARSLVMHQQLAKRVQEISNH